eukprot:GHVS01008973.1.p1 GENE.GHVS01008973.1~~GHVS01008973.1.p1  ORF type:complete len:424 (-),score=27.55 GHVS01008973.1:38-1309(-)
MAQQTSTLYREAQNDSPTTEICWQFPTFQATLFVLFLCIGMCCTVPSIGASGAGMFWSSFGISWAIGSLSYFAASCCALWGVMSYYHLTSSGKGDQLQKLEHYEKMQSLPSDHRERCGEGVETTTKYYDMVTDWYENFWGQSFQLGGAQGFREESFDERCRRHDYWFANRAGIRKGQKWLDVGCGIGGPLRNIIRFTEAHIVGINYNQYQLQRARLHLTAQNMTGYGSFLYCDMNKLSEKLPSESLDGIYALEAVCHSPDKVNCYKEFFSVLKPGGTFACVEWVMTDKYDDDNKEHVYAKRSIEVLGGIPNLITAKKTLESLMEAGFVVEEVEDMSLQTTLYPDPWYDKFDPGYSLLKWPISKSGVAALQYALRAAEFLRLVPAGSAQAHKTITAGIPGTALSGKLGVFTPHLFIKAFKPIIS